MLYRKRILAVGLVLLPGVLRVVPASAQMPAPRITNDNFAQAWALTTGPGVSGHTNVGATTQTGEQLGCGLATMAATVWYSMTVSANSSVVVDTRGSNFDTILSVYAGSFLATLFQVTCNDDISGTDVDSSAPPFSAVPGTTYWIQVGGYSGETGNNLVINITRTPTGPTTPLCAGVAATILGTAAAETIYGTSGNDVIVARGDNDLIYGYGGNDRICAGPGNDYVHGGAGNDRLYGQGGNDRLFGQAGFDVLRGGPGADTCQTGENVIC